MCLLRKDDQAIPISYVQLIADRLQLNMEFPCRVTSRGIFTNKLAVESPRRNQRSSCDLTKVNQDLHNQSGSPLDGG